MITAMILEPFIRKTIPSLEFVRLAFDVAEKLSRNEVCLRNELGTKELLEEVLPIAAFAKAWERPGRHLFVEYFGPNNPYDAILTAQGDEIDDSAFQPLYYVEVTSALFERDHYEREALARYGSVFHDPSIHPVGSRHHGDRVIVNQATAQDADTPVLDVQDWVLKAINAKVRGAYPKPSILVVRVEPSRPLALTEWCSVAAAVSPTARASQFNVVVLVDWYAGAVHRL